jgi:hypothetical protein
LTARGSGSSDPLDGDATVAATIQAAVTMYRAFHVERQYVAANLCPCDGCTQADNLKLKFVAHVGEVATQTIKQRRKVVGIDVIHVHRLLKNPVQVPEYVLFSEDLYRTGETPLAGSVHEVSQNLEGIGPVRAYSWMSRTSRTQSLRHRIRPGSDASEGPSPSRAPACRTCWVCDAGEGGRSWPVRRRVASVRLAKVK